MLEDIFLQNGYPEVSAYDLYSDLYHFGEDYVERPGEYTKGKYNPIAQVFGDIEVKDRKHKGKTKTIRIVKYERIILQDNLEEVLPQLQQYDSSVLYPCGFAGGSLTKKKQKKKNNDDEIESINPQIMFGIILEIDEVSDEKLENLFSHIKVNKMYPMPNYMVCSGGGLHLYYVLSEPLRLDTRELKNQMNFLKELLTLNMWNPYTSIIGDDPQIQTIKQGYRVIGSLTKSQYRNVRPTARAFQTNKEHYSIDDLKKWASSDFDFMYRDRQERLNKKTREECEKLYPEWYQKRIIEQRPAGHYTNKNQAFYEQWLRIIKDQANYGHRYKAVKTLAIVALKCGVPYERLYSDVHEIVPYLSALKARFPFLPEEADKAMQAYYDKRNYRKKYETIIKLANVKVDYKPYKPKGLSREAGLKIAQTTLRLKRETGFFVEKGGRKDTETRETLLYLSEKGFLSVKTEAEFDKKIRGKIAGIAKDIGVSRPTVYKAIKLIKEANNWIESEDISRERETNTLLFIIELLPYLKDAGIVDDDVEINSLSDEINLDSIRMLPWSELGDDFKSKLMELILKYKLDILYMWPRHYFGG